jgi:hypothetical protein
MEDYPRSFFIHPPIGWSESTHAKYSAHAALFETVNTLLEQGQPQPDFMYTQLWCTAQLEVGGLH